MIRILFILSCLCLWGCSENKEHSPSTTVLTGQAMTIDYRIIIGKNLDSQENKNAQKIIDSTFEEVNAIYNKWNPHSELSRLNRLPAAAKVTLSPELARLLQQTDEIVQLTEGRFDPTIEPLQALWKNKLAQGQIPSQAEIDALAPAVGWDKIHFQGGFFYKDHTLTSLDLGGIAKGLCVDLLVERLNKAGFPDVFVEWGGEIRASGHHPDDRPWNIFISRLGDSNPEHAIATLSLNDQAIATSGDYLQNWTVWIADSPVTYFHIIDPKSYHPLIINNESAASASVMAPTCTLADGLATAAMMFPTAAEARAWAQNLQKQNANLSFWIISREEK